MAIYGIVASAHDIFPSAGPEVWIDDTPQQCTETTDRVANTLEPVSVYFGQAMQTAGVLCPKTTVFLHTSPAARHVHRRLRRAGFAVFVRPRQGISVLDVVASAMV